MRVYLDHGATSPVDEKVLAAMVPYFTEKYGNASSLHQFGQEAKEALEESRLKLSEIINASPEEFIFTSGGSESDNLAIKGIAYALKDKGNHIITTKIEHPAVLKSCEFLARNGFNITYIDVDEKGFVNPSTLEENITDNTILVSIMHSNNEIGTIQDMTTLGKICNEKEVILHSDSVQSYTKTKIDVEKQNIGLASFAAHKIHGPKGIGGLYIREDLKKKVLSQIHGGAHEYKLRAGTENVAGAVGFAKAAELMTPTSIDKMAGLRDYMIAELVKFPDAHLNGPKGDNRLCNNVNISFFYIEGESLLLMLDAKGIAISTGSACSSASLTPSHVLAAIGRKPEESHGSVRISLGRENTREELVYAIKHLNESVNRLREMSPFITK